MGRQGTSAFFVPGFFFARKQESPELRVMLYTLQSRYPVGNHDDTAETFFDDMTKLFNLMLNKSEFYIAVRGGPVFWSTVVAIFDPTNPMGSGELSNLVACYVGARQAYSPTHGSWVTNALTSLVDEWMEVEAERWSLPLPGTFQIAAGTSHAGGDSLQGSRSVAIGKRVWPPTHFSSSERALILSTRIRPLVEGRSTETPGGLLPLPTKNTLPVMVTAYLTSFALENYHPGQPWRVGLTSMGNFQRPAEKVRWATATGEQTNLMWSPSGFARFADTVFEDPGVHLAIGLLTP